MLPKKEGIETATILMAIKKNKKGLIPSERLAPVHPIAVEKVKVAFFTHA